MPSMQAAHMGLAGPHDMGTEFIQQMLSESEQGWLAHATDWDGSSRPARGPEARWRERCKNSDCLNKRSGRAALS